MKPKNSRKFQIKMIDPNGSVVIEWIGVLPQHRRDEISATVANWVNRSVCHDDTARP